MSFFTLVARSSRAMPARTRAAVPLFMMAGLYWVSSLPGTPLPDDPVAYALLHWVPPSLQNALHVPAYAALAWAWHWALEVSLPAAGAPLAWAIASAYGVLDEWHQSFVPGRYASLADVALDVAGALIGVWLACRARRPA